MEIIGFLLAILIGLSLGLMGGGGSILTVPILVYVLGMEAKLSIALSLAIVGSTSLIGSYSHFRQGNINVKVALIFGPIAMLGTFIGAKISQYISAEVQLISFAIIMLVASFFMFRGRKESEVKQEDKPLPYLIILIEGLIVGIITGIVGVGGGFLIVPALVLLARIPMKEAIGTSLLIISLKSFSGFAGYLGQVDIPWMFLVKFTMMTAIGIIIGAKLVSFVNQKTLKKSFAIFLVVMGFFILYKNLNA